MSYLLVDCGTETSQEPCLPSLITRQILFGFAYLLNPFLNMWARRGYERHSTRRRPNAGKVLGMLLRGWLQTRLMTFYVQFHAIAKELPLCYMLAPGTTIRIRYSYSRKFLQEVKLGRPMCLCVRFCVSVLPTIDSRGIAGDFTGCGQVQDTTHQFGGEAEYSLIFLYVCAYATMV